ncbi:beta-1,3-galactosyltransferase 5-like [Haliotis rubra]|uniref:beta-1,3-galactosyltransferase 5-like n=1 Tax=Haliotis rubra TaxID=36100 RepID=UPI001EE5C38D|nr:beta-1,3-galactosyltransferase 5-like [Haliotis rubra]
MHFRANGVFIFLVMLQLSVSIVLYIFGLQRFNNKNTADIDTYHEQRDLKEVYYSDVDGVNIKLHRLKRGETDALLSIALENKMLCEGVSQVDLLLVVHSAVRNPDRRRIFRTVLNKAPIYKNYTIRLLFLLGIKSDDAKLQDKINQEFNQYRDIVQGRFLDTYRNLTYKAVMGLKWISHNCRNVKNVVKIDDDVYVDLYNFFSHIYHKINSTNSILCRVLYSRHAVKVNRRGKWAVQKYQFRHYDTFPVDFCSGFAVTMAGSIIPALYKATLLVPIFWVDDVFMYGMVRGFIANLDNLNPELYKLKRNDILKCFKEDNKCKVVFSHVYSSLILPLWQWRQDYLGHSGAS